MTVSDNKNKDVYNPSKGILDKANIRGYEKLYQQSIKNPEAFWAGIAKELNWYKPWKKVLEWKYPFAKWFVDGKTNIVANAVDRHLTTFRRNKIAIIWEGENNETKTLSYYALNREVSKFANVLKAAGIKKGDRVTIYMPRIPEQVIAMLATAKIGAIHSVVYGGFSVEALHARIIDSASKVVITADGGYMNNKIVQLKSITDEAVKRSPSVETVIVVKRIGHDINMESGRDYWYHDLMNLPIASPKCETEVMDAEDPLYILYTSGTTGAPKGVVHTIGGYMTYIYATMKYVFDIKEEDRWWCTADPGWVTGHSYIVYAPLMLGTTSIMYEGSPTYPYPDRWWSIVEKYGVNVLYTTPTGIRSLMRFGELWVNRRDLSSLRLLGTVGEPINPEAWRWYYRVIGKEKCPIMDTWWQTETGGFMITPLPETPLRPGSAAKPFFGIVADVVDEKGRPVSPNMEGSLIIKKPWPGMLRTIYRDPERYKKVYWEKIPGNVYTTGDSAKKDEDGYIWIIGRQDDVIKVSGYRLGTAEIESALVSHPAVAEAAAIGKPHEIKGTAIKVFVVLRTGFSASDDLMDELRSHVAKELGPIAKPEEIQFVDSLPKTRSGKIMRRLLKARELGMPEGDISTLEE